MSSRSAPKRTPVDIKRFESQMEIIDRYSDPVDDKCVFAEFAVGARNKVDGSWHK